MSFFLPSFISSLFLSFILPYSLHPSIFPALAFCWFFYNSINICEVLVCTLFPHTLFSLPPVSTLPAPCNLFLDSWHTYTRCICRCIWMSVELGPSSGTWWGSMSIQWKTVFLAMHFLLLVEVCQCRSCFSETLQCMYKDYISICLFSSTWELLKNNWHTPPDMDILQINVMVLFVGWGGYENLSGYESKECLRMWLVP